MIQIRRIYSAAVSSDRDAIRQVQEIFRQSFPDVAGYADKIPDLLDHPFDHGYRTFLLVSLGGSRQVTGYSLIMHFPEINSSYLDFIAVRPEIKGGGLGSALYEATREILIRQGSRGLYLEALPDAPEAVGDPAALEENRRRLKFYENYGVYPIAGTAYETPIDDSPAPLLLIDPLGRASPLRRSACRAAVRLILTRKYRHLVDEGYIRKVIGSIKDDPVRLRPPRYVHTPAHLPAPPAGGNLLPPTMTMVYTPAHRIHHVRERGYVQRPARIDLLREQLLHTPLFREVAPRRHGEKAIEAVHDPDFVKYLKAVCERLDPSRPVYPYVFPVRRPERKPRDLAVRAGYYCIDTFTPLDRNAYQAARSAVDTALTGAGLLLDGTRVCYALCRPPGHHAGRRLFGGFCYFNNAAAAAHLLAAEGRVAVLDIDFHHGNGTQDIFWARRDVLTLSIHGHPNSAYPYFSGFADETGEGAGRGYNRNLPLPPGAGDGAYLQALERALEAVDRFRPVFLVVCLGYDTMAGDPTGSFDLSTRAVEKIGRRIASSGLPLLVVQEGGYSIRNLRRGSSAFFRGVAGELRARERRW